MCQCYLGVIILQTAKGGGGGGLVKFVFLVFNFRNIPDDLKSNYFLPH